MLNNFISTIYYLGPGGSNAHNAMLKYIELYSGRIENKIPQKSIKSVFEVFENDASSLCILPIENSIEGIVRETIDNFLKSKDEKIQIIGEITLPIKHLLLSKSKDKNTIKQILSHPQALAQCSEYLHKNFINAELREFSSTSFAAQKVSLENDDTIAAIANETCARLFNLNILDFDINDEKDNKTRFYIFGRDVYDNETTGKTAVILSTKNHSGALCDVLKVFAKYNINLTYIDSRPSKKKLGEYLFFMELDGLKSEKKIKAALEELTCYTDFIRVLGSFKIYG